MVLVRDGSSLKKSTRLSGSQVVRDLEKNHGMNGYKRSGGKLVSIRDDPFGW